MASGAEGPKGPLVGPLGGTFQAQSKPEVVLRVLVVGEAAAGKTALLQLLEKHAAELGSARIAQQEEDRAKAAAATEVQTGPLGCPSLTHVVSLEEDSAAAAAAAAAGKAEIQASPLSALMGYRSTCGVNIVPLRCTDTSGENYLVEFWEVGGSSATKATRALLYAMPFDGVWLAYESGSEAAFRSLPAWLLEICMRADTRPSEVFFQRRQVLLQEGKKQRQKQQKLQLEEERSLGDDVELQDLGSCSWGWRLRCGLCPILVVATKADRGPFGSTQGSLQGFSQGALQNCASARRIWKANECNWKEPGELARLLGRYSAVEHKIWLAAYSQEEQQEMKRLACSLLNAAELMSTSAALGFIEVEVFFPFLAKCSACKRAAIAASPKPFPC